MNAWTLTTWTDASSLAAAVDPQDVPEDARGVSPRNWFLQLRESAEPATAIMFLAHAMPRYECVVWAARSLIETGAVKRTDPGIVAALRWIDQPDDGLRRAAADHAAGADEDAPSTALCQAIFLSGGSLAPEDLPPVQPPVDACPKLAAAAVLRAAYNLESPAKILDHSCVIAESILAGG